MFGILTLIFMSGTIGSAVGSPAGADYPKELQEAARVSGRYRELADLPEYQALVESARREFRLSVDGRVEESAPVGNRPTASGAEGTGVAPRPIQNTTSIPLIQHVLAAVPMYCPAQIATLTRAKSGPIRFELDWLFKPREVFECDSLFYELHDELRRWMYHYEIHREGGARAQAISAERNDLRYYDQAIRLARSLLDQPVISPESSKTLDEAATRACRVVGEKIDDPIHEFRQLSDCVGKVFELAYGGFKPAGVRALLQYLEAFYRRLFAVVAANPAVTRTETDKGTALSIATRIRDLGRLKHYQRLVDEFWRSPGFRVVLTSEPDRVHSLDIVEVPDVLPVADSVAGREIRLDSRTASAQELGHELGHILGFPDCYSIFWDEQNSEVVSYHLDSGNFMCVAVGRPGKLHLDSLRGAYPVSQLAQ